MIRDFRATDASALVHLLKTQFPEEEAIIGTQPESVFRVIRRVTRWDARLIFALLRLVGKPVFRMLIYEEEGRLVGTTLLSFPARSVYLSMVVVDPSVRRRGYARALLERSAEVARRAHRQYLVLDVLARNAPARTLYEQRLGYRPLRETAYMTREHPEEVGPEAATFPAGIRRYEPGDSAALVEISRRLTPPEVQAVLPIPDRLLSENRMNARIFGSESGAWVVDRGAGAEALAVATRTPGQEAAHLNDPIVAPTADPALVGQLVRTALAWCGARHALRVLAPVPRYNTSGRAALEREGFGEALSAWTLFRTPT